jgi:tRNA(Ile2) C34 agmatinyltransferase TiaS
MTTMRSQRKLVMRACPRCHGDLLHDEYEDEFRCLQCGRRADLTSGQPVVEVPAGIEVLTPKPVVTRTRAEARRHRKPAA